MKFATILVIALFAFSCVSALKARKMTNVQVNRVSEIRKGNSWASILLNLAELHMMSKGPLDELVQAIEDTITDLGFKREKREEAYAKRTAEHDALVQQLTNDIARCESDISETEEILVMLAEQKAAIEEEQRNLQATIDETNKAMEEATSVREKQHEEYETKMAEVDEALAAVEECLEILNEFAAGGVSFVQVKAAKAKLNNAQNKIAKTRNIEGAFLNALVQVAMNQEFADSGAVNQVISKFNEIKNNLFDSQGKMTADEENEQSNFERFIADSKQVIFDSEETIKYNVGLLEENANNTLVNQNLLIDLNADLARFQQDLQDENDSFDECTERYIAWCEENDRESAVCQEALEVVSTVDMADYIGDRVNAEDGLVSSGAATSQAHGQGTEVFNFDYQF